MLLPFQAMPDCITAEGSTMHTKSSSEGTFVGNQQESHRLRELIMGSRLTQLIHVAGKLGLADDADVERALASATESTSCVSGTH
jgi:hypothetical protein